MTAHRNIADQPEVLMEGLDLQAFAASDQTANPETYAVLLERRAI